MGRSKSPRVGALIGLLLAIVLLWPLAQARGEDGDEEHTPEAAQRQDWLAPVITAHYPEAGLVTPDALTPFRFFVYDPAPRWEDGRWVQRSGLDPDSLRVAVNGVDRSGQVTFYRNARCAPSWLEAVWRLLLAPETPKDAACQLVLPFGGLVDWRTMEPVTRGVIDLDPTVPVPLPQGDVEVVVTISDLEGNPARAVHRIFVDSSGPGIGSLSPPDGGVVRGEDTPVILSLTDAGIGVAADTLRVWLNGEEGTERATLTGERLVLSPAPVWDEGPLSVTIEVEDAIGNRSRADFSYTVDVNVLSASPRAIPGSGPAPLTVRFTPVFTTDTAIERFEWDLDGDGNYDRSETIGRDQVYTYRLPGAYEAKLRVTDSRGEQVVGTVTVDVENAPPEVSAVATPSNGPAPLVVTFTAMASDNEGIAGYEWDFDGDGVYDLQSTDATATHPYEQPGTYTVGLRVTDTQGAVTERVLPTLEVRAGEPGSPSVSLTATPAAGKAPLNVSFAATASDPDAGITGFAWDFDGDGTYDTTGAADAASHTYQNVSTFYPRVRATSADGGTAEAVVEVEVHPDLSLSLSTDTFDPETGGSVEVRTELGGAMEMSLVIENRAGRPVRTLVPWGRRESGSYTDTWDSLDDQGQPVAEGDYYAVLLYRIDGRERRLDLRESSGGSQFNPSRSRLPSRFSPLAGDPLEVTISLNRAAEVTAFVGRYRVNTRLVTLLERRPLGRGTHIIVWNGEDGDGKLFHPPAGDSFLFGLFGFTLADNAVYVRSGAHVTGLSAEPSIFNPQESGANAIHFSLSKPADAELTVTDVRTGRLVARRHFPDLVSGEQTVSWDGRSDDGTHVAPGRYRLGVTAVDESGFRSVTVYALQRVYY